MGITVSCLHPGIVSHHSMCSILLLYCLQISTTLGSQFTDNAAKKLAMSVFWKVMSRKQQSMFDIMTT